MKNGRLLQKDGNGVLHKEGDKWNREKIAKEVVPEQEPEQRWEQFSSWK